MKKVIFYFNDGSYKSIFGYGITKSECINDAQTHLNKYEIEEINSISVYEPLPSEY